LQIFYGCYIFENGGSYSHPPNDVDKAVQLLFLEILMVVLLLMLVDYLMVARMHTTLSLQLKLKVWENLRWYLEIYDLVSMLFFFVCLQKNTRLC
jgi:hypothetical protein